MKYSYTTRDGQRVHTTVAASFDKMAQAFKKEFGLSLHVRSGVRTRAEQMALHRKYLKGGTLALHPDNPLAYHVESNPKGPRALDIYDSGTDAGVTRDGNKRSTWIKRNAPHYGFDPAGYRFSQKEPWHIEFTGNLGGSPASAGNQDVRNRQTWLNRSRGEKLTVDGLFGRKTKAAIKRYQKFLKSNYGYAGEIDGIWGKGTQTAHQRYYDAYHAPKAKGRPVIRKGSRGQDVKDLQARLNRDYPLYSKLKVDGIFGAGTRKVVREFQRRAGLKVDGIVGVQTWAKLGLS